MNEETSIENTSFWSNIFPFVPLGAGILGIILGATALIVSLSADGGQPSPDRTKNQEGSMQVAEQAQALERKFTQLESEQRLLREQIHTMGSQVQEALNQAGEEMKRIHQAMQAHEMSFQHLANSKVRPKSTEPEVKVHRITSGDTFSKIAQEYGVGLQDLIDSNPQADPKRLQLGQSIKIPLSR